MKKLLLAMVCLIASIPFAKADVININGEYGANKVRQVDGRPTITLETYQGDRANSVSGINNPEGAVLTLYGRNDVKVRSIYMEPCDIPNPVFPTIVTKGVKIYFEEIPVTGKYILNVAEGALEIGTDTNAAVQIPLPGEYGGTGEDAMGDTRCIYLTEATGGKIPEPEQYKYPTIDLPSGSYIEGQSVLIKAGSGGNVAYRFTSAGVTTEEEWITTTLSTVSYILRDSGTLEAKTVGNNGPDSEVVSATYTITAAPWDEPTFSQSSGAYPEGTKITITAAEGAFVAYLMNSATEYVKTAENTYTFEVNDDIEIKAYSYGEGKEDSDVVSASYAIFVAPKDKLQAPTFNPASGYKFETETGEVTITAPEGAVVAYKVGDAAEFTTATSNVVKVELDKTSDIVAFSKDAEGADEEVWSEEVKASYEVAGSSVAEIEAEFGGDVEIYNMNGVRVNDETLEPGFYVVVKGGKATKVLVK